MLTSHPPPLRFAIMLQNDYLKQWQYDVIDKLIQSNTAIPVLLIYNGGNEDNAKQPQTPQPNILWRIYEKYILRKGPLLNILLPGELLNTARITCKTRKQGKFSEYFLYEDIEQIKTFSPDFILRFGFSIIRGDILDAAPYGVWSFHHSDEQKIRGGPAGFWETFLGHQLNGVILQKLTTHLDGGIILKKRYYKTTLHDCAYNLHHILQSSVDMPLQVCRDIINGKADYLQHPPTASTAQMYTWPGVFSMVRFTMKQMYRRIAYNLNELFIHEKWAVGIMKGDFSELLSKGLPKDGIHIISYKSNYKYPADPFAITTENGMRLFYENYSYINGKAVISSILINESKGTVIEKQITENNTHNSFPYVFRHEDRIYMIPEQIEKGRVDLYIWEEQKQALIFWKTILNSPLADPVLTRFNDKWWLFGSVAGSNVNNCLNIFFSDSPDGHFIAHSGNPVVFDPRNARMAGMYSDKNGNLWRFAQESHIRYGRNIRIYKVNELTTQTYSEKLVTRLHPYTLKDFRKGIHTLSICPPYIIFDGKKYVFTFRGFLLRLKSKIRKSRHHV